MRRIGAGLGLALLLGAGAARAGVTFEYLFTGMYANSVSADGNAVAGNNPSTWGAYLWTQAGGVQDLGLAPTPSPGGSPGISADGTRVASTILGADSTYSTSGLWTQGSGWQQFIPPNGPPDLILIDRNYSTVYGLSGDGSTVVGLYWRNVSGAGAHAFKWTQAGGGIDLGSINGSSRANGVDYDGNVIVGWTTDVTGSRLAAAWDHGTIVGLTPAGNSGAEAQCVNPSGTIAAGYEYNPATTVREVARWTKTGGTWSATQHLGSVPGTEAGATGINVAEGVSSDGKLIVGYCSFDGSPFNTTGFVWTDSSGTIDVNTFLQANGVYVDPGFYIESCQCLTPDGTCIIGYGQDLVSPYTRRVFRIRIPNTAGVGHAPAAAKLQLAAPSPNPASGPTRFAFTLPVAGEANFAIYDAAGRSVVSLVRGWTPAGQHSLTWDGRDAGGQPVAGGLYFARLATAQGSVTQRLVRIR